MNKKKSAKRNSGKLFTGRAISELLGIPEKDIQQHLQNEKSVYGDYDVAKMLELHNKWRRGSNRVKALDPKMLGVCIDLAIQALREMKKVPCYKIALEALSVSRIKDEFGNEHPIPDALVQKIAKDALRGKFTFSV